MNLQFQYKSYLMSLWLSYSKILTDIYLFDFLDWIKWVKAYLKLGFFISYQKIQTIRKERNRALTRNPVINWVGSISRPGSPTLKRRIKKRTQQPILTLSLNHTLVLALILNKSSSNNIRWWRFLWLQMMKYEWCYPKLWSFFV